MKSLAITLCSSLTLALVACDRTGPAAPADDGPPTRAAAPANQQALPPGHPTTSPPQSGQLGEPASRPAAQPPSDPTVASFVGLEAPKPATWQWQPPRSQMITANYTVPAPGDVEGARAAQLNVYYFGQGMGGSVQDNIDRWKNQFRSPDGYEVTPHVEEFEVNGLPITFVELAGEWREFGAVAFRRDQILVAAIVEAPAGRVFIRLAGDEQTIETNRDAFMKLVRGLRVADGAEVDDPGAPYADDESGGY